MTSAVHPLSVIRFHPPRGCSGGWCCGGGWWWYKGEEGVSSSTSPAPHVTPTARPVILTIVITSPTNLVHYSRNLCQGSTADEFGGEERRELLSLRARGEGESLEGVVCQHKENGLVMNPYTQGKYTRKCLSS